MEQQFSTVIKPKQKLLDLKIRELWRYRDLIMLFVRRTFVAQYKQTILGPAWAVVQPLFTTVIFTFVFGSMAGLAPGGVPSFLFYMCGNVAWTYFSGALTATASTFTANSSIMGKVYFPRLVMPVSTVLSNLISFAIQFVFFLCFFVYYLIIGAVMPNWYAMLTPLLVIQMAALGLGFGIIISALTTKYRDLAMLVSFGVQIWMYLTPVAYDIAIIPEKYMGLYMLNPMTPVINAFRYGWLGTGSFDLGYYLLSWGVTAAVLLLGIVLFNRVEKTFMDTV
jgi:lipopolysaccharide transport system permease protein